MPLKGTPYFFEGGLLVQSTWKAIKRNKHCYLWVSPFYVLFGVFALAPAIYGLITSFTNYSGYGAYEFIGSTNYTRLLNDRVFWKSLSNTLVLWLLIVPLRTTLAPLFTNVLNSKRLLGRRVYSVIALLPYVTAVVVIANIFRMLLATDGGLINQLLGTLFGMAPVNWLDSVT